MLHCVNTLTQAINMDYMYKLILARPTGHLPMTKVGKIVNFEVNALLAQHNYTATNYSEWILRVHDVTPKDTVIIHTLMDNVPERWLDPIGWLGEAAEFNIKDYMFGLYTFGDYHG